MTKHDPDQATGSGGGMPADMLPLGGPPPGGSHVIARLRNYFLTGLIVTGPLAITAYLTWSFVTWVDDFVTPFIPHDYRPETYLPVAIPGWGLIVAFIVLTMLGFLTANLVGRTLVEAGETLLGRMPIVRAIYRSLKQVFETLFSGKGSTFRRVGLIQFPGPGMWSLVFLSQPPSQQILDRLPDRGEQVSVFMPCTPNPTTGFFFYVAKRDVIELDITPEAAASLIMSAGMIQPGAADPQKRLAALAQSARTAQTVRAAEEQAGAPPTPSPMRKASAEVE
jgi:uncharacterized membrane protein